MHDGDFVWLRKSTEFILKCYSLQFTTCEVGEVSVWTQYADPNQGCDLSSMNR